MNLLNIFSQLMTRNPQVDRQRMTQERLQQYARYLRAYQGFSVRGVLNTNVVTQWKRVKFNFTQPVVNLSAGWFAAKPLGWAIENDPDATAEAHAIWSRSGSDAALLESAILCGIYGDMVGLATADENGKAKIEFVDPSIATPSFDGSDYSRLNGLEIAYEAVGDDGNIVTRREMWGARGMETFQDDARVDSRTYDALPACWIRNASVKGMPFGLSDVEPILELVEEYDHLATKQTRIVDYYASPNIVFQGIQKGVSQFEKGVGTVFYLPENGKAYFLEWAGAGPDIEAQLTRLRNAIAEISQVPAVAFGQADSGLTSISGVAIQILYGPLLSKTHRKQAQWGPSLQYLMWQALLASGFALEIEQISVTFPSATPVDGQSTVAEASARIAGRLSARRTEMAKLGVENPNKELVKIIFEEKLLQLVTPVAAIEQDANVAAKAGARGAFAAQIPDGSGLNVGVPAVGGPAPAATMTNLTPAQPTLGDTTTTNDDDLSHLSDRINALLDEEEKEIEAQDGTEKP